jgi:hypothetical protein
VNTYWKEELSWDGCRILLHGIDWITPRPKMSNAAPFQSRGYRHHCYAALRYGQYRPIDMYTHTRGARYDVEDTTDHESQTTTQLTLTYGARYASRLFTRRSDRFHCALRTLNAASRGRERGAGAILRFLVPFSSLSFYFLPLALFPLC